MRVLVMTVVHHPEDAQILHRQIRALIDAGPEAAPFEAVGVTPRPSVTAVDLPRASGRRRAAALRAARQTFRALRTDADGEPPRWWRPRGCCAGRRGRGAHGAADAQTRPLLAAARDGVIELTGFVPNDVATRRLRGALAGLSLLHDQPNYRHSMPTKVLEYMAYGCRSSRRPLPWPSRW